MSRLLRPMLVRRRRRDAQREDHLRPLPRDRLHVDLAAVLLDDRLRDVEPEAGPLGAHHALAGVLALREGLEEALDVGRLHPAPGVPDADLDPAVDALAELLAADHDLAAV